VRFSPAYWLGECTGKGMRQHARMISVLWLPSDGSGAGSESSASDDRLNHAVGAIGHWVPVQEVDSRERVDRRPWIVPKLECNLSVSDALTGGVISGMSLPSVSV
jgi:hypothetical protein